MNIKSVNDLKKLSPDIKSIEEMEKEKDDLEVLIKHANKAREYKHKLDNWRAISLALTVVLVTVIVW